MHFVLPFRATKSDRSPRSGRLACILLGGAACLAAMAGFDSVALALVPEYVEEWSTPSTPEDVEVDPFGRVWVSCDDDRIYVYAPVGGELLFSFGGSGSGPGEFQTPYGIAFDPGGDAYICDYLGARVQKFAGDGTFLLEWPIPSTHADHVAVDAAGDVYVTGYSNFMVHKFTSSGVPLLDWASQNGAQNSGVVVSNDVVHVVQWDAPLVEQSMTDGTFLGSFDASTFGGADVEADALGQLWVCDFNNHVVRVFAADGTPLDVLGSPGSGPGEFNGAIGAAIGLDGAVYVADFGNGRVQRFGGTPSAAPETALGNGPQVLTLAPNPCETISELTYRLGAEDRVSIDLVDVSGRSIARLVDGVAGAGVHRVLLSTRNDGRRIPAGSYYVRLASRAGVSGSRLVVVDP
jgi:hypothetical protein